VEILKSVSPGYLFAGAHTRMCWNSRRLVWTSPCRGPFVLVSLQGLLVPLLVPLHDQICDLQAFLQECLLVQLLKHLRPEALLLLYQNNTGFVLKDAAEAAKNRNYVT